MRLWELPSHLLCSIVGTCLPTSELRKLVGKTLSQDLRGHSDVDVHTEGVAMAGERGAGSRALHKALDARHAGWIRRLGRGVDLVALNAAWDDALASGDIPGAYWAVMSHAATDGALTRRAFGDVHMLSHLVGASNRADLRKLTALERERDALVDRVERQQARVRTALAERDAALRERDAVVAARAPDRAESMRTDAEDALRALVERQRTTIDAHAHRQAELERRLARERQRGDALRERHAASEARARALEAELAALDALAQADDADAAIARDEALRGVRLLYVGGHPHALASLRRETERRGATFLHHDGGVEERGGVLSGLVSRSDVVVFPVDCVSHDGALGVKRHCRQFERPFLALRSAGLSSLVVAFGRIATAARERDCVRA